MHKLSLSCFMARGEQNKLLQAKFISVGWRGLVGQILLCPHKNTAPYQHDSFSLTFSWISISFELSFGIGHQGLKVPDERIQLDFTERYKNEVVYLFDRIALTLKPGCEMRHQRIN